MGQRYQQVHGNLSSPVGEESNWTCFSSEPNVEDFPIVLAGKTLPNRE